MDNKQYVLIGGMCKGSPEGRELHILHTGEFFWTLNLGKRLQELYVR